VPSRTSERPEGLSQLPFGRTALVLALLAASSTAQARSVIKNPGAHPDYSVELEPHLVLDWAGAPGPDAEGLGVGLRASIPLFHNGPISTINNNMAIGFGLDWTYASRPCRPDRARAIYWDDDCSINSYWFPVVLQWNFFLTDVVSVFGEPGLSFVHYRWNHWERCWSPGYCNADGNDTRVRPVFWAGGRFLVSKTFGFVVRLGVPSITAGVTVLL
jgi:hypothetical protein